MGVRSRDFKALVGDLGKTLRKFRVPAREQKELLAILAPMKKDIVARGDEALVAARGRRPFDRRPRVAR